MFRFTMPIRGASYFVVYLLKPYTDRLEQNCFPLGDSKNVPSWSGFSKLERNTCNRHLQKVFHALALQRAIPKKLAVRF